MKLGVSGKTDRALTLVEVLVVVGVIFLLLAFILPAPIHERRAPAIICSSNLKQMGLAFLIWTGDHNDQYPMEVSLTNGGMRELMDTPNAWRTYQVMSNELSTPKILLCPSDEKRTLCATNFSEDLKGKISSLIGADPNTSLVKAFLTGDDNFVEAGQPVKAGLLRLASNAPVTWSTARHRSKGNIGQADGGVQSLKNSGLTNQLGQTGLTTNRLVIP